MYRIVTRTNVWFVSWTTLFGNAEICYAIFNVGIEIVQNVRLFFIFRSPAKPDGNPSIVSLKRFWLRSKLSLKLCSFDTLVLISYNIRGKWLRICNWDSTTDERNTGS